MEEGSDEITVEGVISAINELLEDGTVPKNVKLKLTNVVESLTEDDKEVSMKIDKAMHEIEAISDDTNLQAYTRTQVWNIVSMLEKLK